MKAAEYADLFVWHLCICVCSESLAGLLQGKAQLHKQLQKMMRLEQQLDTDLRDTQLVVAGELSAVRRHVQLVSIPHYGLRLSIALGTARLLCCSRFIHCHLDTDSRGTSLVKAEEPSAVRRHMQLMIILIIRTVVSYLYSITMACRAYFWLMPASDKITYYVFVSAFHCWASDPGSMGHNL